jgi:protein-tyrosine phosphatase
LEEKFDGVPDDGRPKPVSWFSRAWDFAQPIFEDGGVVLLHCAAGVNRGPSMAYFLLRANWHMDGDRASALIQRQRPKAQMAYRVDVDRAIAALNLC